MAALWQRPRGPDNHRPVPTRRPGVDGFPYRRGMRRIFSAALLAVVATVALVAGTGGAAVAAPGESITWYDTRIGVHADGTLDVTETIGYAFDAPRHGIFRKIPTRYRFDGTRDRVYPVEAVDVTMDGAPVEVDRSE